MNHIPDYFNEHQLEEIIDFEISQMVDFKRDYDLRTNNEFIVQLRRQFFQEIFKLSEIKDKKAVAESLLFLQNKTKV